MPNAASATPTWPHNPAAVLKLLLKLRQHAGMQPSTGGVARSRIVKVSTTCHKLQSAASRVSNGGAFVRASQVLRAPDCAVAQAYLQCGVPLPLGCANRPTLTAVQTLQRMLLRRQLLRHEHVGERRCNHATRGQPLVQQDVQASQQAQLDLQLQRHRWPAKLLHAAAEPFS